MEVKDVPESLVIKPVEIQTEPLNLQLISPFCISWSQNDSILIVAEGGVFVFELWPVPPTAEPSITFRKSWIPATQSVPLLNAVVNDNNDDFLWSFKKKEVFEIAVDSTLSQALQQPNVVINKTSVVKNPKQIVDCQFSPLIRNKSYMACLSNSGLLEIYKNISQKWVLDVNVTTLWICHCSTLSNAEEFDFSIFKSRMYKLKIISMQWSDEPELLFLTGHESGEIVVWNVTVSDGDLNMSVRYSFHEEGKPCCLKLMSLKDSKHCLLCVGKTTGDVRCLTFDLNLEETSKKEFWLWENNDLILPSSIKIAFLNKKIFVFTIKDHILLIQTLSVDESNNYSVEDTTWREFSSTIVGFDEYRNNFIMCLQNHDVYIFSIKDIKSIDIKLINTNIKEKHKNAHHCYGITFSKNKAMWILASSPKINYDSLKVVTHLIIYSPETKIFKSASDTTASGLIDKIVKEYDNTRLGDIFDFLELKKLELLESLAYRENFEINNVSLLELQLLLWEVKLKLSSNTEVDSVTSMLELAIAKKRAEKNVSFLSSLKSLSELEKKSLDVSQALLDENKQELSSGVCLICGSESFYKDARISSCSNSHSFPRCCLSLLPCDVIPYMICRNCDSVALPSFVTESDCHCPYCDGLLELDCRLRVSS